MTLSTPTSSAPRRIKSKERVSTYGEVFTADREVNAMLDLVKQIDAAGILDMALSGTSATLLARRWESALLVNVDNLTLRRLMDTPEALRALMNIEGFRTLNRDIETILNKSDAVKEVHRAPPGYRTPGQGGHRRPQGQVVHRGRIGQSAGEVFLHGLQHHVVHALVVTVRLQGLPSPTGPIGMFITGQPGCIVLPALGLVGTFEMG